MKKFGLLEKIPRQFLKKNQMTEDQSMAKNSTATGGDDDEDLPNVEPEELGRKQELLNTIQLPKNIKHLSKRLPGPQYQTQSNKKPQ